MGGHMSTERSIAKSAGVLGGLMLISRVLGFARDVLIAQFFGTTMAAEAFVVSFKLPNLFRDLVGEGAMNSAIVPVLSEVKTKQGLGEFWKLAQVLLFWFIGILTMLTVLGVVFAPWVIRLIAPGFSADPDKFALTVELTRLIYPFIFLVGLWALMMGVLNTIRNFGSSAIGSSLLNMSMIMALIFATEQYGIHGLAIGILVGGVAQCLVQCISLATVKIQFTKPRLWHPGLGKVLKLLGPRIWGTAVYQISVFIDTILASFSWIVGDGGNAALYYASRLFQLPLAIFGVSLAQAALPTLSDLNAQDDREAFCQSLRFAFKNTVFTSAPAMVGLAVLAEPIVTILFKRNAFDAYSTQVTSSALLFYSFGLVSCSVIKVFVNGFYALHDTKTPVKTATISLVANLILNIAFMWKLKIGGLALATSIAATLNVIILGWVLHKRVGLFNVKGIWLSVFKSMFAAVIMAVFAIFVCKPWIVKCLNTSFTQSIWSLSVSVIVSAIIYYLSALALRSHEAKSLNNFITRRL
ncbi:MAG: putative peptidoglycan lipid II flippase [Candidatus Omnitrophota bacterium]|jgi:putative peptidoglycan lipid II flippase